MIAYYQYTSEIYNDNELKNYLVDNGYDDIPKSSFLLNLKIKKNDKQTDIFYSMKDVICNQELLKREEIVNNSIKKSKEFTKDDLELIESFQNPIFRTKS